MTDVLIISVNGTPGAQGSKRHVGRGVMVESSKKVKPWRSDVKDAAERTIASLEHFAPWAVLDGPLHASITFRFPRPKGHYRTGRNAHLLRDSAPVWPTSRALGDVDKLVRSTFDALVSAGVAADDSLFARVLAEKVWCSDGQPAGALIRIRPLTAAVA
ncbi:RusA family crossover junction endodeoxyribonuclease [Phycicoccus avicenniae]|uniref:RusA family crossover junction endodeoxyribonuclease n=1 Tax=Phycicoccus avicenniae TaxID=2828860 RepID=UPI003D2C0F65